MAIDNDGTSVWVVSRCGATPNTPPGASAFWYDGCAGSKVAPVTKRDAEGHGGQTPGAPADTAMNC